MVNKTHGYSFSENKRRPEISVGGGQHHLSVDWLTAEQPEIYISFEEVEEEPIANTADELVAKTQTQPQQSFKGPFIQQAAPSAGTSVYVSYEKDEERQEGAIPEVEARTRAEYFGTLLARWAVSDSAEDLASDQELSEFDVSPTMVERDISRLRQSLSEDSLPEDALDEIVGQVVSQHLNFIRGVTGDGETGDYEGAKEALKRILRNSS